MRRERGTVARSNLKRDAYWGVDAEIVYTGLRLLGYYSALTIILLVILPSGYIHATQLLTADGSAYLIGLAGIPVTQDGILLHLPSITLQIDFACTAITIMALYVSLILAYRAPWKLRLLGIGVGLPVIVVANLARIVATAFTAEYAPNLMHTFHDYLFQVSMVVVAVALWAWWFSALNRAAVREATRG